MVRIKGNYIYVPNELNHDDRGKQLIKLISDIFLYIDYRQNAHDVCYYDHAKSTNVHIYLRAHDACTLITFVRYNQSQMTGNPIIYKVFRR